MAKVKKGFGTFPEEIVVLSTPVAFDSTGIAEVEAADVLAVLDQIQGYTIVQPTATTEEATSEDKSTAPVEPVAEEEATSEVKATKAPATKRRAQPTKK